MTLTRLFVLLGLACTMIGCGAGQNRFQSEAAYAENRSRQLATTSQTVAQLRQLGVTSETQLNLEYFFHTDTLDKGSGLARELMSLGYTSGCGHSKKDNKQVVVTGKTSPMPMDDKALLDWTDRMCSLGQKHDCAFAGWGANPKQQ